MQRGLDCVARFAQRLRSVPLDRVSIVGTAALREAQQSRCVSRTCATVVAASDPNTHRRGRSRVDLSRCVARAGRQRRPPAGDRHRRRQHRVLHRRQLRSAARDQRRSRLRDADRSSSGRRRVVGEGLCRGATRRVRVARADRSRRGKSHARDAVVIGTSGTIESVQSVLVANGFDSGPITREGIAELEREIRRAALDLRPRAFPGSNRNASTFFRRVSPPCRRSSRRWISQRMEYVDASLQHGLLYDLTARRALENVQERTVAGWQHRFSGRSSTRRAAFARSRCRCSMRCRATGVSSDAELRESARLGGRSARDRADGVGAATESARRVLRRERRVSGIQSRRTARDRVADPQSSRRISAVRVRVVFAAQCRARAETVGGAVASGGDPASARGPMPIRPT